MVVGVVAPDRAALMVASRDEAMPGSWAPTASFTDWSTIDRSTSTGDVVPVVVVVVVVAPAPPEPPPVEEVAATAGGSSAGEAVSMGGDGEGYREALYSGKLLRICHEAWTRSAHVQEANCPAQQCQLISLTTFNKLKLH